MNWSNKKLQCSNFCLIVPNPFKEVLHIFWIQAPNMMHRIMAFALSIISPHQKVSLNQHIFSLKVASCDTLVIRRIDFRHDHCKWKILGKVAAAKMFIMMWFHSTLPITISCCRAVPDDKFEVQIDPTCTKVGFTTSALSRGDRIWRKGTSKFSCSHLVVYISLRLARPGQQLLRETTSVKVSFCSTL